MTIMDDRPITEPITPKALVQNPSVEKEIITDVLATLERLIQEQTAHDALIAQALPTFWGMDAETWHYICNCSPGRHEFLNSRSATAMPEMFAPVSWAPAPLVFQPTPTIMDRVDDTMRVLAYAFSFLAVGLMLVGWMFNS